MRLAFKIGLLIFGFAGVASAVPGGPPGGLPILNSEIYQKKSAIVIDTATVKGILQLPYGSAVPPSNQCTVSSQTGRIFIVSSATAGGARIYICEGVNGWQIKTSSTAVGGGGGTPGGLTTQFQYNDAGSLAGADEMTTNGSTVAITKALISSVTVSSFSLFQNVSTTTFQNVSTFTFSDGMTIDMSGINLSSAGEGFLIPQTTDCSYSTREGSLCWDTDDNILYVGTGSGIATASAAALRTLNGASTISSPTQTLNFNSSQFTVTAPVSSTAAISLNGSIVTLKGNSFLPIKQVQKYVTATSSATSSTTFVRTSLSGSFTPILSTSKLKITVSGHLASSGTVVGYASIYRDSTNLATTNGGLAFVPVSGHSEITMIAYDTPGGSGPFEYNVRFRTDLGTNNVSFPTSDGGIYTSDAVMLIEEIAQ